MQGWYFPNMTIDKAHTTVLYVLSMNMIMCLTKELDSLKLAKFRPMDNRSHFLDYVNHKWEQGRECLSSESFSILTTPASSSGQLFYCHQFVGGNHCYTVKLPYKIWNSQYGNKFWWYITIMISILIIFYELLPTRNLSMVSKDAKQFTSYQYCLCNTKNAFPTYSKWHFHAWFMYCQNNQNNWSPTNTWQYWVCLYQEEPAPNNHM